MEGSDLIDVVICGAGAAGLALAIDLARRGVRVRLVDQLDTPFAGSRGKGIQPRTHEVFEDLGMIDALRAVGGLYPPHRNYAADGSIEDVQDIENVPPTVQEPYRAMLMVAQFNTERVMRERLAALGATPQYGQRVTGFDQDDDGVTVRIDTVEGERTLRCRYLVGADGGRSFIRRTMGLDFPGQTLGVRAIVADVTLDGLGRDVWHRFNAGNMLQQLALCPLPAGDLYQLQAPIVGDGEPDLSLGGLQAFVDARIPRERQVRLKEVRWASAYAMSSRLVDRYRVGRVFLAGDACHIHPPTGAQGLNTSVQDSYNLGWKLAAVLGGASDALLDTYEEERRPTAAAMLGLTTGILDQARTGGMRRGREVGQLDLHYGWSSLSLSIPRAEGGVMAGDRAPDAVLTDAAERPRRLFDLFAGPHWTVIGYEAEPQALPPARPGLEIVRVGGEAGYRDPDGGMASSYGLTHGDVVLVRPDGYVAAIAGAGEVAALGNHLERWSGPVSTA